MDQLYASVEEDDKLGYSKSKAAYWVLLTIYYALLQSRAFNFFLVHVKGEAYAREFREKRRPLGSKVIR